MNLCIRMGDICLLINYPQEFSNNEKLHIKMELHHHEHNVVQNLDFKKL